MHSSNQVGAQTERRPLRTMFVATCVNCGGLESLLVDLIRGLDRARISPELCCLKNFGEIGRTLAEEIPATQQLLAHKFDLRVLRRLIRLMRRRQIDAVVTVGTGGDKMFWGRLAAWFAGVPVIVSAIHSTGVPDHVEWSNRRLEPLTDAFIAVAEAHGRHLAEREGCPAEKVRVICNGVDAHRFAPRSQDTGMRRRLGLPADAPLVGLVAELRPEKNHQLWLRVAAEVHRQMPQARFVLVGDGPERARSERLAAELGVEGVTLFCGRRRDVPDLLPLLDVFFLSSLMEANPVSILEAMSCGKPIVTTNVGSIRETVAEGVNGFLCERDDLGGLAARVVQLLADPELARRMGQAGRQRVLDEFCVERMVEGYEDLIEELYDAKRPGRERGEAVRAVAERPSLVASAAGGVAHE